MTNCILIGELAGVELPDDSDGVIILGDDIVNLDRNQPDVLFLGDKCAIGKTLFGAPLNLKNLIEGYCPECGGTSPDRRCQCWNDE